MITNKWPKHLFMESVYIFSFRIIGCIYSKEEGSPPHEVQRSCVRHLPPLATSHNFTRCMWIGGFECVPKASSQLSIIEFLSVSGTKAPGLDWANLPCTRNLASLHKIVLCKYLNSFVTNPFKEIQLGLKDKKASSIFESFSDIINFRNRSGFQFKCR